MLSKTMLLAATLAVAVLGVESAFGAALTDSLKKGSPEIKSAGPIAFGPEGILLVGDPTGATITAIATDDTKAANKGEVKVEKIDDQIAGLLGTMAGDITIVDMKVNPASGNIYFSVARGKGTGATPAIVKLDRAGKVSLFELKDVPSASVKLPNPSMGDKTRTQSITSIAFVKDKVIVAGLSNEEFASTLRSIPFPFKESDKGASVEIFHGNHGKLETNSPVRTFTTLDIKGETNILAAYTCTPLVTIPVSDLKTGEKVKGKTVAELGKQNRPLDMIVYKKDGKDYILMANSARGVMKVTTEGIDKMEAITKRVPTETAGLKYDTIAELKDVVHLDKLDDDRALLLVGTAKSGFAVKSVPLP